MEFNIRPYRPTDFGTVLQIFNEIIEEGRYFYWYRPLNAIEFAEVLEDYTSLYVACDGDLVIGFYMTHPNHIDRGSHIANASYGVSISYRGGGAGRKLVEHSMQTLKQEGYRGLQFNCVVATNYAINLYERLGFTQVGVIPKGFQVKDGSYVDSYIYYKEL